MLQELLQLPLDWSPRQNPSFPPQTAAASSKHHACASASQTGNRSHWKKITAARRMQGARAKITHRDAGSCSRDGRAHRPRTPTFLRQSAWWAVGDLRPVSQDGCAGGRQAGWWCCESGTMSGLERRPVVVVLERSRWWWWWWWCVVVVCVCVLDSWVAKCGSRLSGLQGRQGKKSKTFDGMPALATNETRNGGLETERVADCTA